MFQTKVVQKIKTRILCSVTFPRKSYRLWDNMGKYCRAGQDIDGNMAHAHCMMDTDMHSEYVILIALPIQRWFHEPYSTSRYKHITCPFIFTYIHKSADKSLARPTSRCILFDGENISFDASLVIYINSTNIPPIMIINRIYEHQNILSL